MEAVALFGFVLIAVICYWLLRRKEIGQTHFVTLVIFAAIAAVTLAKWDGLSKITIAGYSIELLESTAKQQLTNLYRIQVMSLAHTNVVFLSKHNHSPKEVELFFSILSSIDKLNARKELHKDICAANTNILETQHEYVKYFSQSTEIENAFTFDTDSGKQNIPTKNQVKEFYLNKDNIKKAAAYLEVPENQARVKLQNSIENYHRLFEHYRKKCA